ncbi:MAG: PorP/SprF family type IX secretion system membrane protein [Bacteroidales bacterium]|nr:PorP/SprF family type IX secretion system membrane protein [Bacteroidales bacterium]
MKKILLIISIFLAISEAYSQDLPFVQQYIFDQTLLNPALGAKYDFVSIKLSGVEQWMNMPNHPKNQTFSYNMKFNNNMGFNAALLNESYGEIQNSGIKFSYFYYTKLNVRGDYISYGVSGSAMNFQFNLSNDSQYSNDPTISQSDLSYLYPNAGLGIYYHHDEISLGFSAGNLLPYKPKISILVTEPTRTRTYFFYAETKFANPINTFAVIPSFLLSVNEDFNRQINISTKMVFNNTFWVGIAYRDALDGGIYAIHNALAMTGFKFFKRLNFSYGYDFSILSSRSVIGGTHFFMLGYDFFNPRDKVPMYF